mmetsp:Transcript_16403/g.41739  ORF Transcript_16403/g.41739 Transcript_16403/m.41739 type:complete len:253 (-) Transcript_16403:1038-1796(-)
MFLELLRGKSSESHHDIPDWAAEALVELEAIRQHWFHDGRKPSRHHWWPPLYKHDVEDLRHLWHILVRKRPAEHLNETAPQAPDVHLLSDDALHETLWSHVAWRSTCVLIARQIFSPEGLRLAKVAQFDIVFGIKDQILRFQVAVDDHRIATVHILNRAGHSSPNLQPDCSWQVHPVHVQQVKQISIRNIFCDNSQIWVLQDTSDVFHDCRVVQRPVSIDLSLHVQKLLLGHRAIVTKQASLDADFLALMSR